MDRIPSVRSAHADVLNAEPRIVRGTICQPLFRFHPGSGHDTNTGEMTDFFTGSGWIRRGTGFGGKMGNRRRFPVTLTTTANNDR